MSAARLGETQGIPKHMRRNNIIKSRQLHSQERIDQVRRPNTTLMFDRQLGNILSNIDTNLNSSVCSNARLDAEPSQEPTQNPTKEPTMQHSGEPSQPESPSQNFQLLMPLRCLVGNVGNTAIDYFKDEVQDLFEKSSREIERKRLMIEKEVKALVRPVKASGITDSQV